jgi:hypothetical protein
MERYEYDNFTISYRSRTTGALEVVAIECPRCKSEVESLIGEGAEAQCRCGVYLAKLGNTLFVSPAVELKAA